MSRDVHAAYTGDDELEIKFLKNAQISIGAGMSGVFDKFMGSYVLLERQNLEELLQRLGQVHMHMYINKSVYVIHQYIYMHI